MEISRRDLIASVTAGIALSNASAASTKAVPNPYPGLLLSTHTRAGVGQSLTRPVIQGGRKRPRATYGLTLMFATD
jgi:hypothetical protein